MKNFNLLYLLLLFVTFAACKKESDNSPKYFIKAVIGDSEKIYTDSITAVKGVTFNTYGLNFSAYLSSNHNNGLEFEMAQSNKDITSGTYTQSNTTSYSIVAVYKTGTSGLYYSFGAFYDKISATEPLQITISTISNTQVSGTFSGMFYSQDAFHTDSLRISNGSFYLPIQ